MILNPVPVQSPWMKFSDCFEIAPDRSSWSALNYRHTGQACVPDRQAFQAPSYGLSPNSTHDFLRKTAGIYLVALSGEVLYVGRARRAESIWSRLGKHRIKLTGSMYGNKVHHPARWRSFVTDRYRSNPGLICSDRLENFSFSYYALEFRSAPALPVNVYRSLEAEVFDRAAACQAQAPRLNDPARIDHSFGSVGIDFACP